jgi:multiple antibiotic resistance protein
MPGVLAAFLLAFPALFSIVNPIAGAFIFREATADRSHADRVRLARRVGLYSLLVMLGALWGGSYVLAFFGISIAALRIAGGLVLTGFAWELLGAPEKREDRKQQQASDAGAGTPDDVAFYPLTLPFTTGPGTISVAVALGAGHPPATEGLAQFFGGVTLAALALAAVIALTYAYADRLGELLGRSGSRTLSRLSAFILFCIGVQVFLLGVTDVLEPLLARR